MSKALWVYMVTGEFGLPTVYKPSVLIRELRKLYAQHQVLNKQIRVFKNNIQSVLADNGVVLPILQKNHLLSEKHGKDVLEEIDISEASRISIKMNQEILWCVLEKKEELVNEILRIGEPLKEDVELLISIRGITPLTALAFLADVGDIRRFKTLRYPDRQPHQPALCQPLSQSSGPLDQGKTTGGILPALYGRPAPVQPDERRSVRRPIRDPCVSQKRASP